MGLHYWRGIVHVQNYTIPLITYLKNTLVTYIFKLGRLMHSHIKTLKESNTCIILR